MPTAFARAGLATLALVCVAAFAAPATAQDYPARTIRLIVPYAAGGGVDVLARMLAQKMNESFGQPVIVENKVGASGELATDYVKNQPADGYTLLVAPNGPMAVSPATKTKLSYSVQNDFTHLGLIASFPLVLVVNPDLPIKSVADFVAYAKAHPDKANYAEPSVGFQLIMEILKGKTGAPLQMIPYKSSSEAVLAVVGGNAIATLVDSGPATGSIKSGKLRALAISSAQRAPEFPDVPTFTEAGFPEMSLSFWCGFFGPAGLPPAVAKKLEAEMIRIVTLPDIQQKMKSLSEVPEGRPGAESKAFIADQIAKFSGIAKAANLVRD